MKKKGSNLKIQKVDFDEFANKYDEILEDHLNFFGEENSYFAEYKIKLVKSTINSTPLNILEFGCGIGRNLKFLADSFSGSNIYGCDISEESLNIASQNNPEANLFLLDPVEIEKHQNKFDLIFISCVFHHINPSERKNSFDVFYSMLEKNGVVYLFEHNPYNPVTKHIVNTCPWDEDAILINMREATKLFEYVGLEVIEKKYALFFPAFLKILRPLENYLGSIPMGGQYYIKGLKNK